MLKEIKFALCAAAVGCAALSGFADTYEGVTNDFETTTTFTGSGWLTNNNVFTAYTSKEGNVGYPIVGNHENFLWVEGDVSCNNVTDSDAQSRTLDFLMVAEEYDEDGLPDVGDEQFRLAFDEGGKLNLFCTPNNNGGETSWVEVTSDIPSGTWVRVTMNIKYGSSGSKAMAQLIVDGNPCTTTYGYAESNKSGTSGTWYEAATAGTVLTRVDFSGIGGVDDFVLRETPASASELPGTTQDVGDSGVESSWLIDNGISASNLGDTTTGGTGYTYQQAYDAGVNPKESTPLYVTDVTIASNASNKMQIAVNGTKGTYKVKRSTSSDMTANVTTEEKEFTEHMALLDLPNDPAETTTYFYEVVAKTDSVATTNKFGLVAIVNTSSNVLISVPWVDVGSGVTEAESDIALDKLISTKNLTAGDKIYWYDSENGKYKYWQLSDGIWTSGNTAAITGTETAESASDFHVSRGDGIFLERIGDRTKPFYLYGQYSVSSVSKIIGAGKMALLANPNPSGEYYFTTVEPSSNNDKIIKVNGGVDIFTYDTTQGKWGHTSTTFDEDEPMNPWGVAGTPTFTTTESKVKAGEGFWYKNNGSTANTISF